MRNKFDEQLHELNNQMINMGTMIEESIGRAVQALSTHDEAFARSIMDGDREIDNLQKKIESICFNLLIQQQPVARDLRAITAAMKMVTDMERIGDHASDIAEVSMYLRKVNPLEQFEHITKMAIETTEMLNQSIEAYVYKNEEKAKEVINHDDIVDQLFIEAKKDIVNLLISDPDEGEDATDLLMIAKYFERIGDHATNIAEWVIYSLQTQR